MSTRIAIRVDGAVARLQLDGADRLNAIGTQTYTDLAAAIRTLESQTSVRAVIVHGSGRVFCAGADIAEIQTFSGREAFAAFLRGFTHALDALVSSPLPVIAAIHGSALGGGLELAMACDLRVATPDATLGLPEAKLGVLPGAGGTQRLPRLIPVGVATEMLMLGNVIDGQRAHALGLVNRLSGTDTLIETAGGIAEQLATGAARVASVTKSLLQQTGHLSTAEGIPYERNAVADLFDTADGREGFRAFTERRAPTFDAR